MVYPDICDLLKEWLESEPPCKKCGQPANPVLVNRPKKHVKLVRYSSDWEAVYVSDCCLAEYFEEV